MLELEPSTVNALFREFCRMDVDRTGSLQQAELAYYIQQEQSPFLDHVFSIFDDDKRCEDVENIQLIYYDAVIIQFRDLFYVWYLCVCARHCSGELDFLEFISTLWCLLTLRPADVGGFAFIICDKDESASVSSTYDNRNHVYCSCYSDVRPYV